MQPHLSNLNATEVYSKIYNTCLEAITLKCDRPYYTYGLASEYAISLGIYWFEKKQPSREMVRTLAAKQADLKASLGESYSILKNEIEAMKPYKIALDTVHDRIYQIGRLPDTEKEIRYSSILKLYQFNVVLCEALTKKIPFNALALETALNESRIPYSKNFAQLKNRTSIKFQTWLSEIIYGVGVETTRDTLRLREYRQLVDNLEEGQPIKGKIWPKFEIKEHQTITKDEAFIEYIVFIHKTPVSENEEPRPWIVMFSGASSPYASASNGLRMRDLATHTDCNVLLINNRTWSIQKQCLQNYTEVQNDTNAAIQDFLKKYDTNPNHKILDTLTLYGHCGGGMIAQLTANYYLTEHNKPLKIILDRNPPSFQIVVQNGIQNALDAYVTPKSIGRLIKNTLNLILFPIQLIIMLSLVAAMSFKKPLLTDATALKIKTGIKDGLNKIIHVPSFINTIIKLILRVLLLPLQILFTNMANIASYTPWATPLAPLYLNYPPALKRHFSINPKRVLGQKPEYDFLLQRRSTLQDAQGRFTIYEWRNGLKVFFRKWLNHEEVKKNNSLHSSLEKLKKYIKEAKTVKTQDAPKGIDPHYVIASGLVTRCNQSMSSILKSFSRLKVNDLYKKDERIDILTNQSQIKENDKNQTLEIKKFESELFQEGLSLGLFEIDRQRSLVKNEPQILNDLMPQKEVDSPKVA